MTMRTIANEICAFVSIRQSAKNRSLTTSSGVAACRLTKKFLKANFTT